MRRKVSLRYCLLAVLASLYFLAFPSARAESVGPVLITQNVDESKLVTLGGNTRPEAQAKYDRGRVADNLLMEHLLLLLKRSPEQEQELGKLIDELTDSSSPNFHRWLTAKEFGESFGVAEPDRDTIKNWLRSHGLKVNVDYTNDLLIDFSGTAGQVREAFHTEIHNLNVKGVKHIANMSDPRIPAALAPAVVGVVSLHNFMPHTLSKLRPNYTFGGCFVGTCYVVVPADLATIYNLNPLFSAGISGQGQTIVVIEDTNVSSTTDWTTFRSTFGLSSYTTGSFTQINPAPPNGANNCTNPGVNGAALEATVDAEYASAAAPSAAIVLASCSNTATFGGLIALQNLLNESGTPPAIMSISYGECEAVNGASANAAFNSTYQQAVTEGVAVFVAAGDNGATMCSSSAFEDIATYGIGVSGFTSTPYNVSVGGTDYGDTYAGTNSTYWNAGNSPTYGSAKSYVPEIPWNDSCASSLIAEFNGFSQTYGSSGFCNSSVGEGNYLDLVSGSGGPSGCATGSPSQSGVVSGTCAGWPKPSWQTLVGNPSDGVRDIPDVSLFAADGVWDHYYLACFTGRGYTCTGPPDTWLGAGGTSFASPIMAGIQALVNQKTDVRQGNPNPVYYSLAASEYGASGNSSCNSSLGNRVGSSCIFYDVTLGDNDVDCTGTNNCYLPSGPFTIGALSTSNSTYQPAYGTQTGWDFPTGIGTVNAFNLVNNWPSPGIYAPVNNATLAGTSATFQWYGYPGATAYWLDVGSTQGGNNYYSSGSLSTPTFSLTVTSLPSDGSTVWARWYYMLSGTWQHIDYSYTAFGGSADRGAITSPTPSSTLSGSSVTFTWSAGAGATQYWLDAGSTPGGQQYTTGNLGNVLTKTVNGLPTNGSTIYVTLYSLVSGTWLSNAYTYTAAAGGVLTTPPPGTTLSGSTVTFDWTAGAGTSYWLDVGSTLYGQQYTTGNLGNVLTKTVSGLPANGSTIYVTLYSLIGGVWSSNSYTYTALNTNGELAVIQTPAPGSTLSGNAVTFTWSADANATQYWLDVGSTPAGQQYATGNLGNVLSTTVYSLPADGSTIYTTLYSLVGGQWLSTTATYVSGP